MVKVRILTKCQQCDGKAYLPVGETVDSQGNKFIRHRPCSNCEGSGLAPKWIELSELLGLLEQSKCLHEHVSTSGGFHLTAGEIWDDVEEVCSDCGKFMR